MLRCPPDLSISRPPLAPLPSFRVLSALLSRSKAVSSRSFMSLMPPAGRKESSKGLSPTFSTQATYHLFEKPSSGRQNPVLKDQDHLPSQKNLAKSCHLTDTQPSKDSPSNPHDPASWPCYSHSLLCATNHHHFCKRPRITYCSAYHSPPGDMVAEC